MRQGVGRDIWQVVGLAGAEIIGVRGESKSLPRGRPDTAK